MGTQDGRYLVESQKKEVLTRPTQSTAVPVCVRERLQDGRHKRKFGSDVAKTSKALGDLSPLFNHVYLGCTQRVADHDESVTTSYENELFRRTITSHGDGSDTKGCSDHTI